MNNGLSTQSREDAKPGSVRTFFAEAVRVELTKAISSLLCDGGVRHGSGQLSGDWLGETLWRWQIKRTLPDKMSDVY